MKSLRVHKSSLLLLGFAVSALALMVALSVSLLAPSQNESEQGPAIEPSLATTTATDDSAESNTSELSAPELPLELTIVAEQSEYHAAETLERWRLLSDATCADYALAVLESIHAQDLELVQAGFMDVSGESWGCVFIGNTGESLAITLIPENPFSSRSESNQLVVSILRYLEVEGLV